MLRLHQQRGQLIAELTSEYGRIERVNLSSFQILGQEAPTLLNPILARLRLMAPKSIASYLERLRWLGDALTALRAKRLPRNESEWQRLVLDIHHFVFTRADRRTSLMVRSTHYWLSIRAWFSDLMQEGLIPVSVDLPPVRANLNRIDISPYEARVLGQRSPICVEGGAVNKLLIPINLARTDAEYLEEFSEALAHRRRVLYEVLTHYWNTLKTNYRFGKELVDSVDWPSLKAEIEARKRGPFPHPANPYRGREGLRNYLAVCFHLHNGGVLSSRQIAEWHRGHAGDMYLPSTPSLTPIFSPSSGINLPPNFVGRYQSAVRQTVLWWLGQIVILDVVMISALLMMIHPSWTPYSLLRARLVNEKGKLFLNFADTGLRFAIEKGRARELKTELLDDISLDIITTLIEMSARLRARLRANNDPRASLLFLPFAAARNTVHLVHPSLGSEILGGGRERQNRHPKSVWIGEVYPQLAAEGLGVGTIGFSKIRNTEAVLEWLRTGSLKAVTKKLGNTERVVLEHYLPRPLLDAYNTRMIRRFQNLWIAVSAAKEDFLLDVTDFSRLADLHAFLRDMLQLHSRTSSPLAEALHNCFYTLEGGTADSGPCSGHLHVAVSPASLSALYTYRASVIDAGPPPVFLDTPDPETGLAPRYFLQLASLLRSCLPRDKNPAFRSAHEAALQAAADPKRPAWHKLFLA